MRKLILSIMMLLCVAMSYGQTAKKLFKKYKKQIIAEYSDLSKQFISQIEQLKHDPSSALTAQEWTEMAKGIKSVEQLHMADSELLTAALDKDVKALQGYELLLRKHVNPEEKPAKNPMQDIINEMENPDVVFAIYGKPKGDKVKDMLLICNVWDDVIMIYFDCNLSKGLVAKGLTGEGGLMFNAKASLSLEEDSVLTQNMLVVINGKPYPELHSEAEAKEYMKENGIEWNHENWLVDEEAKEKYPDAGKSVVVEFYSKK